MKEAASLALWDCIAPYWMEQAPDLKEQFLKVQSLLHENKYEDFKGAHEAFVEHCNAAMKRYRVEIACEINWYDALPHWNLDDLMDHRFLNQKMFDFNNTWHCSYNEIAESKPVRNPFEYMQVMAMYTR